MQEEEKKIPVTEYEAKAILEEVKAQQKAKLELMATSKIKFGLTILCLILPNLVVYYVTNKTETPESVISLLVGITTGLCFLFLEQWRLQRRLEAAITIMKLDQKQ